MKIYLASDHAAFDLKSKIRQYLEDKGYSYEDVGTFGPESVNWAQYGAEAAAKVSQDPETTRGIIICGSGIGMSIVSNKFKNVRAALCNDITAAQMSRKHNNANVLNMGARVVDDSTALQIVDTWLNTDFEGGRHQERLNFLADSVEKENFK